MSVLSSLQQANTYLSSSNQSLWSLIPSMPLKTIHANACEESGWCLKFLTMLCLPRTTAMVDPTTRTIAIDINKSSNPAFLVTIRRAHMRAEYTINVNVRRAIRAIGTAQPLISGFTWFGSGQDLITEGGGYRPSARGKRALASTRRPLTSTILVYLLSERFHRKLERTKNACKDGMSEGAGVGHKGVVDGPNDRWVNSLRPTPD